jgi:hypothetical protein
MKKQFHIYLSFMVGTLVLFTGCKDEEIFQNNVFISTPRVETILNKPSIESDERSLQIGIARLEANDITVNFDIDASLVAKYNAAYHDNAKLLPASYYTLSNTQAKIVAGSVISNPILVTFHQVNTLNRDSTFVLPIQVNNSNLSILESARTTYYVVKGGALINVVADIESNNLHISQWKNPAPLNNLSQITMEGLIRVRNYDRMISTFMGIEGRFLIRLGDANFPTNQIQVATSRGNYPGSNALLGLSTNEWVHVAVTYNASTSQVKIFVNGKPQSQTPGTISGLGNINLALDGVNGFYIGRSYADDRYLAGEVAECRIWNVERTEEEIANNPYDVDPESAGLVAYWKCNEGSGNLVKDHTANENHLTAKSALKWTSVSLPAAN